MRSRQRRIEVQAMADDTTAREATGDGPETADGPDWPAYYRHTLGREPRPLFVRGMAAMQAAGSVPGRAVEIGFGDGTETLTLLADGWHVLAIDPTSRAAEVLRERVPDEIADRLQIVTAQGQDIELPPFDLLYAGYALSFIEPAAFAAFWDRVRSALRPGGFLVVNVFGTHDTWADDPSMTFLDRDAATFLLEGFEVVAFDETDEDGDSFSGRKHWHIFDIVARAPLDWQG
jgi:methyltransferase family protein